MVTLAVSNILEVVSILLPLPYDLGCLGGSWAQRKVFSITLIQAAINSKQLPLALALVAELKVGTHKHAYCFEILFLAFHVIMHKYKHLL